MAALPNKHYSQSIIIYRASEAMPPYIYFASGYRNAAEQVSKERMRIEISAITSQLECDGGGNIR